MNRRTIYLFLPFLALALFLLLFNLLPGLLSKPAATSPAQAGLPPPSSTPGPQLTATPIATAVPNFNEVATDLDETQAATAEPIILPDTALQIYGPPRDGRFVVGEIVNFYWAWPEPLPDNWHFQLGFFSDAAEWTADSLEEANLGNTGYRQSVELATPGPIRWQIRLVDPAVAEPRLSSEPRLLIIEEPD